MRRRPFLSLAGLLLLAGLGCGVIGAVEDPAPLAGPAYWTAQTATPVPTMTVFLGTSTPVYAATPVPGVLTTTPEWTTVTATPEVPPATPTPDGFAATPFWVTTPTIVVDCDHSMDIAYDESFGPVVAVMKFKTEEEAIRLANDSPYGLSASVWSKDLKRGERVAKDIITGNVSINSHMLTEGNPALPFGGIKDSGFGRYKGDAGIYTFCNSKSILIDVQGSKIEPHWYPFTPEKYDLLSDLMVSLFSKSKNWIKFAITGLKIDNIGNKQKIK